MIGGERMDRKTNAHGTENAYRGCIRRTLGQHVLYTQAHEMQGPWNVPEKSEEMTLPPYRPFPDDGSDPTAYMHTQSVENVNNLL